MLPPCRPLPFQLSAESVRGLPTPETIGTLTQSLSYAAHEDVKSTVIKCFQQPLWRYLSDARRAAEVAKFPPAFGPALESALASIPASDFTLPKIMGDAITKAVASLLGDEDADDGTTTYCLVASWVSLLAALLRLPQTRVYVVAYVEDSGLLPMLAALPPAAHQQYASLRRAMSDVHVDPRTWRPLPLVAVVAAYHRRCEAIQKALFLSRQGDQNNASTTDAAADILATSNIATLFRTRVIAQLLQRLGRERLCDLAATVVGVCSGVLTAFGENISFLIAAVMDYLLPPPMLRSAPTAATDSDNSDEDNDNEDDTTVQDMLTRIYSAFEAASTPFKVLDICAQYECSGAPTFNPKEHMTMAHARSLKALLDRAANLHAAARSLPLIQHDVTAKTVVLMLNSSEALGLSSKLQPGALLALYDDAEALRQLVHVTDRNDLTEQSVQLTYSVLHFAHHSNSAPTTMRRAAVLATTCDRANGATLGFALAATEDTVGQYVSSVATTPFLRALVLGHVPAKSAATSHSGVPMSELTNRIATATCSPAFVTTSSRRAAQDAALELAVTLLQHGGDSTKTQTRVLVISDSTRGYASFADAVRAMCGLPSHEVSVISNMVEDGDDVEDESAATVDGVGWAAAEHLDVVNMITTATPSTPLRALVSSVRNPQDQVDVVRCLATRCVLTTYEDVLWSAESLAGFMQRCGRLLVVLVGTSAVPKDAVTCGLLRLSPSLVHTETSLVIVTHPHVPVGDVEVGGTVSARPPTFEEWCVELKCGCDAVYDGDVCTKTGNGKRPRAE